jgi:hypothetical protein
MFMVVDWYWFRADPECIRSNAGPLSKAEAIVDFRIQNADNQCYPIVSHQPEIKHRVSKFPTHGTSWPLRCISVTQLRFFRQKR